MKKRALIILSFLIIISGSSFSQDTLVLARKDGLWGYINLQGKAVIDFKYKKCNLFKSGFSKIGETAFINKKGEDFNVRNHIKVGIDKVREFSDGLLAVKTIKYWGYMNAAGELVIPTEYKYCTDFKDGYAMVKKDKEFLILDKKGGEQKIAKNEKDKITAVKKISEGLAPIKISKKCGFIDEQGNIVIEAEYESVGYFKRGLAWVKYSTNRGKRGRYINKKGEDVAESTFIRAKNFDPISGLARIVGLDGKKAYVKLDGDVIHFDNSREYKNFVGGMCRESEYAGDAKIGYLNKDGEWAIKPTFKLAKDFNHGYAPVYISGDWGIINEKGEWVIEPKYYDIIGICLVD